MQKEPIITLGVILALIIAVAQAALGIADAGGFENGVQTPEWLVIVAPLVTAIVARLNPNVWSQATVDALAPREAQAKVVARRRRER
jgi:hypothetical protein